MEASLCSNSDRQKANGVALYLGILNCYPITSTRVLWGSFEVAPLEINSRDIFGNNFYLKTFQPWRLCKARRRITPQNLIPEHIVWQKITVELRLARRFATRSGRFARIARANRFAAKDQFS